VSRDPESILHEADYWQALLDDVRELNQGVLDAAGAVSSIPVTLLELLLSRDPKPATEKATAATRAAMDAIGTLQPPIDRLIELATGRLIGLRAEAGLPPLDES
jgi:hypothetical protein